MLPEVKHLSNTDIIFFCKGLLRDFDWRLSILNINIATVQVMRKVLTLINCFLLEIIFFWYFDRGTIS